MSESMGHNNKSKRLVGWAFDWACAGIDDDSVAAWVVAS